MALKFISKTKKLEKEVKSLRREIDIMRSLRHPNIVQMLDSFDTDHEVVVVTEFAQGELFQILQDDRTLPEDQVCVLFFVLLLFHMKRYSTNNDVDDDDDDHDAGFRHPGTYAKKPSGFWVFLGTDANFSLYFICH